MEAKLTLYLIPSKPPFTMAKPSHRSKSSPSPNTTRLRRLSTPRAASSPNSNPDGSSDAIGKEINGDRSNPATEPRASPKTLIRYRALSRRQAKQEREKQQQGLSQKLQPPAKKWEEMTLSEKVLELYVGEKGLLFWLNKFAYASIFAVIGGWILFRFVGPSLGLYQLDSAPLSPSSLFKDG